MTTTEQNPVDLDAVNELREERERLEQLEAGETNADWRWLMGSKRGRRMVWRLLATTRPLQPVWEPGLERDAILIREGRRNVGLELLALLLEACAELVPVMAKENT